MPVSFAKPLQQVIPFWFEVSIRVVILELDRKQLAEFCHQLRCIVAIASQIMIDGCAQKEFFIAQRTNVTDQ